MLQEARLQSIQVGHPQRYGADQAKDPMERSWSTSFFRTPVTQPLWLYSTHLEGNEQADKKNHGRPSQAVLLYSAAHYPLWQQELQRPEMSNGGFGENFTIAGLSEETVCLGDVYSLGKACIEVSGPRYPCWKIERRWQQPGLTKRVAATGRTGWYCSVRHEGLVQPGEALELLERPYPRWTIALINDFAHGRRQDEPDLARELAQCPLLDEFWQRLIIP
ncbi:MOSC domain-containing protein [Tengunoibacter tsumagoiensis]|uniref:Molybdenum cofactor biosysynthesis protein n=1 Tax=Tengunoibacter tsumagoiensis TaxID=2014871 RepID=A0A401ZWQ3_9CHLR|nr:MOSC domain-containing protein [Tengunoibacter tsumagoiensis]GCE11305.1 molybdenum cofactor biosysynthesis protein [Tengunoibacter tsumagoiensis]